MTRDEKILDAARRMARIATKLFKETNSSAPICALEMATLMYKEFDLRPEESENSDKEIQEVARKQFVKVMPELLKTYMSPDIERILARQGLVMDVDSFIEAFMDAIGYKANNPIIEDKAAYEEMIKKAVETYKK